MASVWDVVGLPDAYQAVANALSEFVKSAEIRDIFVTKEHNHGAEVTREMIDGNVRRWDHFHVATPSQFLDHMAEARRGEARTAFDVLWRSVHEFTPDAVNTVVDLIEDNAIYRGQEFLRPVMEFLRVQTVLLGINAGHPRKLATWSYIGSSAARFKNSAIGTLVQDLSEGMDIEKAVKLYESKVAPTNYKRSKSLITKSMVDQAMKTIRELELEPSLSRRHARFGDVSVNNVLYVDGAVRPSLQDAIQDLLMEEVKPARPKDKDTKKIGIDQFISDVLPGTTGLHLFLDNALLGNFASITAPMHEHATPLFKWNNGFAWSYDGNVADSIKERVKKAGGRVDDVSLRVSLTWTNYDDLDIHVMEPDGRHIYYGSKHGLLDVDMNAGTGVTREPVENVRWPQLTKDGTYKIWVNQYRQRESTSPGFEVEIESDLGIHSFRYEKIVDRDVQVATVIVRDRRVVEVKPGEHVIFGSSPKEKWGLKTQNYVRVNSVILSPNHWDSPVGNKHWFFVLEGCSNPLPVRGIYNEFLRPDLNKHRKVFEILGDKTRCAVTDQQLSGIGFSSTQKNEVVVETTGPDTYRGYTVEFGR
jgi:hypothetical protein